MSACYKMYSIVQRVYPLTVDSLLSPGTLSIAFVILINYFTSKISNDNSTYICFLHIHFLITFLIISFCKDSYVSSKRAEENSVYLRRILS